MQPVVKGQGMVLGGDVVMNRSNTFLPTEM